MIGMEDINRLKLVLVEKKKTSKWLAEQLKKDPSTVSRDLCKTDQVISCINAEESLSLTHETRKDLPTEFWRPPNAPPQGEIRVFQPDKRSDRLASAAPSGRAGLCQGLFPDRPSVLRQHGVVPYGADACVVWPERWRDRGAGERPSFLQPLCRPWHGRRRSRQHDPVPVP